LRLRGRGLGRFLFRLLALSTLHLGPLSVEPRLEDTASLLRVLPRRELRLVHMGHRFRTVLLLRPPENRSAEGVTPDEPGEEPLEVAPRQIRPESFVDQIAQIRGDLLRFRRLDR